VCGVEIGVDVRLAETVVSGITIDFLQCRVRVDEDEVGPPSYYWSVFLMASALVDMSTASIRMPGSVPSCNFC